MKARLFNKKSMPKERKISQEEIEKTKIGYEASQFYFWLQYNH